MKLELFRRYPSPVTTIGELYLNGRYFCYTLEDPVRERPGVPVEQWKIKGDTAIPEGTYNVILNYSPRFQRNMPLICSVEGFEGVRIHTGNLAAHTEGCILVGYQRGKDFINESRAAFKDLYELLQEAVSVGDPITLSVWSHKEGE